MKKLVDLDRILRGESGRRSVPAYLLPFLEQSLAIRALNDIYAAVHGQLEHVEHDPNFFLKTLKVMGVHFETDADAYGRIPTDGPLIVVANHPFGGLDGVVLGALLQGVRSDVKLMGNYLLSQMDGIRGSIISVDPFGGAASKKANLAGMRSAIRWLKEGGCIGAFPAGEVSSLGWRSRMVEDPPWTTHIAELAMRTGASVLPVCFEGRNSNLFQVAGLLHPRLRTMLLPREFARKRNSDVRIRIGERIPAERLHGFESGAAATDFLRLRTYALLEKWGENSDATRLRFPFRRAKAGRRLKPLAPVQLKQRLRGEVAALPPDQKLVEHGNFSVYYADAGQIPKLLLEIGRLREATFRSVAEGTGLPRDLDQFDAHYLHLFMWDHSADEIVGAYRIGLVDRILPEHGRRGIYSGTLFRFRHGFLENLGPAIELGRSFICEAYQKKHASLAIIWRGIGEFVSRNPEYKILFGPVSITNAYQQISKNLMVHFLREHNFDTEMGAQVRPRKPPKSAHRIGRVSLERMGKSLRGVDSVSAVISGFEPDRKGIPILLRHYLKLNGTLLSFNVDPAFSDVIDGLILVDLRRTDARIMERYLSKEGYARFAKLHGLVTESSVV